MKKVLIVFLGLLCLVSCDNRKLIPNSSIKYLEFTYKGHDMIEFDEINCYGCTIIHSPECRKCKLYLKK